MAKRQTNNQNTQENKPDALIIEKANFTNKLLDRIEIGKEIYDRRITNISELEKAESDYYKWDSYNSEYLQHSFNNEKNSYKLRYDNVNMKIIFSGDNSPNKRLEELKEDIKNKIENLEILVEKVELLKSEVEINSQQANSKPAQKNNLDKKNIFIVHGHNNEILQTVARTIDKLGLNPIILHEQANAGRTIIEKFENHSNVGFAIVLLTDDDEGKSKNEIELQKRARQNVVLELGYFIGKLGRSNVLPLYSQGVELPSDINGLLYIPIDKSNSWQFAIVKELKEAGYDIDANLIM